MDTKPIPPVDKSPSSAMQVDHFRQILWLPLRCSGRVDPGKADAQGTVRWFPMVGDPLLADDLGGPLARDDAYAHYLYFHPYIRRFLFEQQGDSKDAEGRLRIWTLAGRDSRDDRFACLDVVLPLGQSQFTADRPAPGAVQVVRFTVERCRLYQFPGGGRQGVLMLEIELAWHGAARSTTGAFDSDAVGDVANLSLTLADVLDLLDFQRRTHPPYFPKKETDPDSALHLGGGRYPLAMEWRSKDHPLLAPDFSARALRERKARLQATVFERPRASDGKVSRCDGAPIDRTWRDLLGPGFAGNEVAQIEDERMPLMAYVALPEPHRISKGDWIRLAFCDYRGDSQSTPYADGFCKDFASRHCYDRYFQPPRWTTRFLNTGYAFVMVGGSHPGGKPTYFTSDLLVHFRRHYASMGLLAQFNKAALLTFSSRLNEAILKRSRADAARDEEYRAEVRCILADLLEFTHRHWFDGVSNQLQAGEVYEYWVRHLGLRQLYEDVMGEARAAHEFVVTLEESDQTAEVKKLTRYGLWFAACSVVLGLAGAGFPVDKPLSLWLDTATLCVAGEPNCHWSWARFFTVLAPLGAATAAAFIGIAHLINRRNR